MKKLKLIFNVNSETILDFNNDYFEIKNEHQWWALTTYTNAYLLTEVPKKNFNEQHITTEVNSKFINRQKYKLLNDMDFSKVKFEIWENFNGELNGNNKTMKNIIIFKETEYSGIFSKIENAKIHNLIIDNFENEYGKYTGVIAGDIQSSVIDNIKICNVNITGKFNAIISPSFSGNLNNIIVHLGSKNEFVNIINYFNGNMTNCYFIHIGNITNLCYDYKGKITNCSFVNYKIDKNDHLILTNSCFYIYNTINGKTYLNNFYDSVSNKIMMTTLNINDIEFDINNIKKNNFINVINMERVKNMINLNNKNVQEEKQEKQEKQEQKQEQKQKQTNQNNKPAPPPNNNKQQQKQNNQPPPPTVQTQQTPTVQSPVIVVETDNKQESPKAQENVEVKLPKVKVNTNNTVNTYQPPTPKQESLNDAIQIEQQVLIQIVNPEPVVQNVPVLRKTRKGALLRLKH